VSDRVAPDAVRDLADVAEQLRRVTVELTDTGEALASGVLWPSGHVLTSAHVVRRPRMTVGLLDGRRLAGQLVARDPEADLALLRVAGAGFPTARLADPAAARVGTVVVAVGHPLGIRRALTMGVIHAVGPIVTGGRSWIQADLRLAPGNSGGPLADATASVVGLNTMIAGGLALAIPTGRLVRFVRAAGVSPR
jgi:serine protease Do